MFSKIKSFTAIICVVVTTILISGCASLFIPKKQTVTIKTNHAENEVYHDNGLVGKGKSFTTKLDKSVPSQQIVIVRKGYKNVYEVAKKTKRPAAFYPLLILDIPFAYYGGFQYDFMADNCKSYDKEMMFNNSEENLLPIKTEKDKYLNIASIRLDVKDKNNDLIDLYVSNTEDAKLKEDIQKAEDTYLADLKKQKEKQEKKEQKKGKKKKLDEDTKLDNTITSEDTEFSDDLYKILKKTKFIDTVRNILNDQNNTLVLDAAIKRVLFCKVHTKLDMYYKTRVELTWYLKNTYDEIVDSIPTKEFSGNFSELSEVSNNSNRTKTLLEKMVSDAITISYLKLYKNKSFTANSKLNTDYAIKDNVLSISSIADADRVSNKKDAFQATVIVKTKENDKDAGHGSGFAISKDGYILTNYHVIAGEKAAKQKEIVVITADGTELKAKIIRFNKFRDVALLKVENTFTKAFYLDNQNKADVMLDVYTIGAPKSIELGQSVSAGIISSMRDVNENKYLQLGMSINGGNSGGAIFDTNGNLHGVVVSKLIGKNTEGVAFAIPSYMVANYLNLNAK